MDRIKATTLAALVILILFAPTASAQQVVAANLAIISGNGQLPCPTCSGNRPFRFFYPLVVKVTDASGSPIAGKLVSWQVIFVPSAIGNSSLAVDPTSVTDSAGIAVANISQGNVVGTIQQPILQSTVLATVDNLSATFYVTQALVAVNPGANTNLVQTRLDSPVLGNLGFEIGGPAGSTGTGAPIIIHVDAGGVVPVTNVSVRLLNDDPARPFAVCATQPGADPGSVLTDANGNATCNPVFGSTPGRGRVSVLVGGLDPANYAYPTAPVPLISALGYIQYNLLATVTPVTPAALQISGGNNQSVNGGQTSLPLIVKVTDATGAVPVASANVVTWSFTPAAGAFLTTTTSSSDSNGLAQTTLTLLAGASGKYTVKAALASNPSVFVTFTVTTNIQVSTLTKLPGGDGQTVPTNQTFGTPLAIQVTGTNGQPLPNVGVNFAITGPGTLSASSAFTDGNGRAQVSVKAGNNPGTITVVVSVANISQSFTLTVIPPGPSLSTGSFVNAAGRNSALSPCGLATAVATGLAPGATGLVLNSNSFGPWGTTLAGVTVSVNNVFAPIYSVGTVSGVEQVTFQIPCEATPGSLPVTITVGAGTAASTITVTAAAPGIFETLMTDNTRRAVALRPDGTFVTLQNPARRGEVIRVLVTGMGPTTPPVGTGSLPVPGSDALVTGQVIVGVNNAGARVVTARLSPNLIGVYEVAFQVATDAPTENDVVLSVAVNAPGDTQTRFSNGSKVPIQ